MVDPVVDAYPAGSSLKDKDLYPGLQGNITASDKPKTYQQRNSHVGASLLQRRSCPLLAPFPSGEMRL